MTIDRRILVVIVLVMISSINVMAQLPEPKPVYIDSTKKGGQLIQPVDSLPVLVEPLQSFASLVLLLERPGHQRVGFAAGSPIVYYVKGDPIKLSGIVVRVEREAIYVNSDRAGKQTVPIADIQKIIIPNTGSAVGLFNAASIGLGIGSIGYLLLSILNPGVGNEPSFSNPRTIESLTYSGTGLALSGLFQYLARDKRIKPGNSWKFRVDEYNSFYGPVIQQ